MKKIRKNALKLFLFVCLGLTLTTIVYASARINGDGPSSPSKPWFVNVGGNGCQLSFYTPIDNGGAPIQYYVIQHMYKDDFIWYTSGTTTTFTFAAVNMREGKMAQFRVRAVNKFGMSEPSEASEFIIFKD